MQLPAIKKRLLPAYFNQQRQWNFRIAVLFPWNISVKSSDSFLISARKMSMIKSRSNNYLKSSRCLIPVAWDISWSSNIINEMPENWSCQRKQMRWKLWQSFKCRNPILPRPPWTRTSSRVTKDQELVSYWEAWCIRYFMYGRICVSR